MGLVNDVTSDWINLSLYGQPKTGKTRLLATFPKPVIILGAEDGTKSVRDTPNVHFVRLLTDLAEPPEDGKYLRFSELEAFLQEAQSLLDAAGNGTVGLDNASALNDLLLANILGLERLPEQKSWGMATRDQYGQASLQIRTIIRRVLEMRCHSVIIAHEKTFRAGDEGAAAADTELVQPMVGSMLSDKVCGWLNGAVDYVCQTFKRLEEVSERRLIPGTKDQYKTVSRRTGRVEYCLRVGPHPTYTTGFRHPPGTELPDVIVNPTFDKIYAIATGGK